MAAGERSPKTLIALAAALALCIGIAGGLVLPYLVFDEVPEGLDTTDSAAARYALVQVENAGGAAERTARLRSRVVEISPDPSECRWGYREDITAIVTVKTYTIFGTPLETWQVDCNGPEKM